MNDILKQLYSETGFDKNEILKIASGERYTAVMLKNGHIGVCANISLTPNLNPENLDFNKIQDRILITAYYNAKLNYEEKLSPGDLLEIIDFERFNKIAMIGYFKPVYEKLLKKGKKVVFFNFRDIPGKQDDELKSEILPEADAVIISATTVFNKTLGEIISLSKKAKKFLLGPTSLMSKKLLNQGLDGIFGVNFEPFDTKILTIINQNGGTRDFLKFAKKVALLR